MPLNLEADLQLEQNAVPHLMHTLSRNVSAASFRREQSNAEHAIRSGRPYYDRRAVPPKWLDGAELDAFVRSRAAQTTRKICLLSDIIVRMNNNGANELHTQVLAYHSLSRHNHGLNQIQQAINSVFGVGASYGAMYRLTRLMSRKYLERIRCAARRCSRARGSRPAPPLDSTMKAGGTSRRVRRGFA